MADWDVVRQPANGVRQSNAPMGHRPPAQRCGNAATLGYISNQSNNLNEVVAKGASETRKRNGRNTVGIGDGWRTVTQGSSFLATLGFGRPQPRWGWYRPSV